MSPTVVLEVDADAAFTKTFVGPVAWLVLEHLALEAHDEAGELVAAETARSIAGAVSVSKDTAPAGDHPRRSGPLSAVQGRRIDLRSGAAPAAHAADRDRVGTGVRRHRRCCRHAE